MERASKLWNLRAGTLSILKFFNIGVLWSEMVKSAAKNAAADCCERRPKVKAKDTTPYVKLFKALGDETRLQILGLLAGAGAELCVCDIEANFDLSQPTVSHHIRLLREAGIIVGERRGNWIYYAIDRSVLGLLPQFKGLLGG